MTSDDETQLALDVKKYANLKPTQVRYWVAGLLEVAERVSEGTNQSADMPYFWTHLHGVLYEVYFYFKKQRDTRTELLRSGLYNQTYVDSVDGVFESLEKVRGSLDSDELEICAYERHCACHVFQEDYVPQVKAVNDALKVKPSTKTSFRTVFELMDEKFGKTPEVDTLALRLICSKSIHSLRLLKSRVEYWVAVIKRPHGFIDIGGSL